MSVRVRPRALNFSNKNSVSSSSAQLSNIAVLLERIKQTRAVERRSAFAKRQSRQRRAAV
jgi:hypothetical protein